jgi:hypothetical protein
MCAALGDRVRHRKHIENKRLGRGGAIRTPDPLRPRQVRYQAALRPDNTQRTIRTRCDFSSITAPHSPRRADFVRHVNLISR